MSREVTAGVGALPTREGGMIDPDRRTFINARESGASSWPSRRPFGAEYPIACAGKAAFPAAIE